ncbi:Acetate kinase [Frankliniella fusca]|uniref:Acetate kinase n=1 Tax=Frankliniella fusca TaxID=407009 RepID=A0AAE1L9K1_9NEOP|nr:Acetate kinase [Frankliniella fusca]
MLYVGPHPSKNKLLIHTYQSHKTTSTTSEVLNKHWSTATLAAPLISAPLKYCFNLRLSFASNTSFSTSFTFSPKTNPVSATTSATDLDPNLDQIPDFKDCFNYSKNVQ